MAVAAIRRHSSAGKASSCSPPGNKLSSATASILTTSPAHPYACGQPTILLGCFCRAAPSPRQSVPRRATGPLVGQQLPMRPTMPHSSLVRQQSGGRGGRGASPMPRPLCGLNMAPPPPHPTHKKEQCRGTRSPQLLSGGCEETGQPPPRGARLARVPSRGGAGWVAEPVLVSRPHPPPHLGVPNNSRAPLSHRQPLLSQPTRGQSALIIRINIIDIYIIAVIIICYSTFPIH